MITVLKAVEDKEQVLLMTRNWIRLMRRLMKKSLNWRLVLKSKVLVLMRTH